MSEQQAMQCPTCGGSGSMVMLHPPRGKIKCLDCKGTGVVTDRKLEWMEIGALMRSKRLCAGRGLRQEAERRGMKPSELSQMETGRMKPVMEIEYE